MEGPKTIAGEKGTQGERSFVMVRDDLCGPPGAQLMGEQIKPDGVSRQLVGKVSPLLDCACS